MRLIDYIDLQETNAQELSERLGVARWTVQRWALYGAIPKPAMMTRIVEATRGAVSPGDFYSGAPEVAAKSSGRRVMRFRRSTPVAQISRSKTVGR